MRPVRIAPRDLRLLAPAIGSERWIALQSVARHMRGALDGHRIVNITEAPPTGGVREMILGILGYASGAGITVAGFALDAGPAHATVSRRVRECLHGLPGDDGPLGADERRVLDESARAAFAGFTGAFTSHDLVLLHGPGTAPLIPLIRANGGRVVWRSHAGSDTENAHTSRAWSFLEPFLNAAQHIVVNRTTSLPPGLRNTPVSVITPSVDPGATRNLPLAAEEARATLVRVGVLDGEGEGEGATTYRSETNETRPLPLRDLLVDGPIPSTARLVVQVGDWDSRTDMPGVLAGFAHHTAMTDDVHLLLCGPENPHLCDPREAATVLARCRSLRAALSPEKRSRIHILALPEIDDDVTAHIVNAIQVAADVVVQKSRAEGFSLTAAEAMWKGRPIIASGVGGLTDLIADERDGLLLGNPDDLDGFGRLLSRLLSDPALASGLGAAARTRVQRAFLPDRHLLEYANLLRAVQVVHEDGIAEEVPSA